VRGQGFVIRALKFLLNGRDFYESAKYHKKYSLFKQTSMINSSNRELFPCLHSLIYTRGGLGELETVMQLRDVVENLLYFRELSQLQECLDEAM